MIILLLAVAMFCSAVAAVFSFGWLSITPDTLTAVGFLGLALVAFFAAELVGRRG